MGWPGVLLVRQHRGWSPAVTRLRAREEVLSGQAAERGGLQRPRWLGVWSQPGPLTGWMQSHHPVLFPRGRLPGGGLPLQAWDLGGTG